METLPCTDCSAVHPPQPYPSSQPLTAKCSLEDPPQPRHQTNGCQGAHGRSPAWSKEPVLLGPRRHPSLCRARSWNPAPAPSSQVPRLQASMALDSSVTHPHLVCGGSLGALPSKHIPALVPAHRDHSVTRHHLCLGDCNGSPASLPLSLLTSLCPCAAVGANLIKHVRSGRSSALSC